MRDLTAAVVRWRGFGRAGRGQGVGESGAAEVAAGSDERAFVGARCCFSCVCVCVNRYNGALHPNGRSKDFKFNIKLLSLYVEDKIIFKIHVIYFSPVFATKSKLQNSYVDSFKYLKLEEREKLELQNYD